MIINFFIIKKKIDQFLDTSHRSVKLWSEEGKEKQEEVLNNQYKNLWWLNYI